MDETLITKIIDAFTLDESQQTALRAICVEINTALHNKKRQANEVKRLARVAAASAKPISQEHTMSHDYLAKLFESSLGSFSERQVHALGTTIKCFIGR